LVSKELYGFNEAYLPLIRVYHGLAEEVHPAAPFTGLIKGLDYDKVSHPKPLVKERKPDEQVLSNVSKKSKIERPVPSSDISTPRAFRGHSLKACLAENSLDYSFLSRCLSFRDWSFISILSSSFFRQTFLSNVSVRVSTRSDRDSRVGNL